MVFSLISDMFGGFEIVFGSLKWFEVVFSSLRWFELVLRWFWDGLRWFQAVSNDFRDIYLVFMSILEECTTLSWLSICPECSIINMSTIIGRIDVIFTRNSSLKMLTVCSLNWVRDGLSFQPNGQTANQTIWFLARISQT